MTQFLLFFSRSPISIAAAAIYMASQASKEKRSAKGSEYSRAIYTKFYINSLLEIGEIAGAAEVTVRHTYKLFLPVAEKLFPADFKFDIEQLPAS